MIEETKGTAQLTRCLRRISTRNNYFGLEMCNINAILTGTEKNRDFLMPLTVLNEPPVVQYAANVNKKRGLVGFFFYYG